MPEERHKLEVLLDSDAIADRVAEMGRAISADYRDKNLTALVVLNGGFVFAADLLRAIDIPLTVEFIGVSSYGSNQCSSGVVEITLDDNRPFKGRDVLIVEDIVDTGLTISHLLQKLEARSPASIGLASLIRKPSRSIKSINIDYLGFEIPNVFVVGYGLDYRGEYRNLPHIARLPSEQD